jgi:hypothetical protein
MVVSLIALFFALGGVGYAKKVVHLINGSTITKGSIQVDRLSSRARAALTGSRGLQGAQGLRRSGTEGRHGAFHGDRRRRPGGLLPELDDRT